MQTLAQISGGGGYGSHRRSAGYGSMLFGGQHDRLTADYSI